MNTKSNISTSEEQQFVAQDKDLLESDQNQVHASYWHNQLAGALTVFEVLPKMLPPDAAIGYKGESITGELSERLFNWVHELARTQSLQPDIIFLTVFKLLLHKYSGKEDIIIGMNTGNHGAKKLTDTNETFVNTIPIRSYWEEELKFDAFLQKMQRNVTDAVNHSGYPFSLILEKLNLKQTEKNTIFGVTYSFHKNRDSTDYISERPLGAEGIADIHFEVESDLELEIIENQSSFSLIFKYNPHIYVSGTVQRLFDYYNVLLSEISNDPDCLADAYPIITDREKQKLLVDFNNTSFDYPRDTCIHQLFVEKVIANRDKTAILFENVQLTYQQLYDKCYDLALFLQSMGIEPDSRVGLCLERSAEMMLGIQGILIAGGAYVPLDPDYPDDRLAYMLEDSQASIVLCQGRLKDKLTSLVARETKLIALDESWGEITAYAKELKNRHVTVRREVQPRHLAYIIYTSGSTGKPKGVMVEHQALMNRIDWMQRMYPLNENDVVLQKTPFSFDVSVWEFVWPLMAGASVVFAKPAGHKDVLYLEDLIKQSKVTTLHFVPSMLHTYLDHAQSHCKSVKQMFCSGEALDRKLAIEYKIRFPEACLHNLYGPTEAAIDVTFFNCSQLKTQFVPIGAPISNIQIYILDKYHNPQPMGVPGELYIAGTGLARGYHNRPELTKEKFVPNPFNPGTRMYKSGDLACWLEDGNIEYLGRIDTQVKIRGFRIETGEIETRLTQHPEVNNSCVVVQGQNAQKQLIAFYHAKDTKEGAIVKLPVESLRSYLLQTLPDYMLPAAFVSLEAFPMTPNGKLNRYALEVMDVHMESSQTYLAPRDETEQQLVTIWAEVLNMKPEKIGINDNFFELGGHSLLIAQLISKIKNQLTVDLPLNTFFDLYTIAGIAEIINAVKYQGEDAFGDVEFEEIII